MARRFLIVFSVGWIVVAFAAESSSAASTRSGKRDYPESERCPYSYGPTSYDPAPFVFKATAGSAVLTFVACSQHGGDPLRLFVDDLYVVRKDVFDLPANRIPFPRVDGDPVDPLLVEYELNVPPTGLPCYAELPAVSSVFRRNAAPADSKEIPLAESFDRAADDWTLGGSARIGAQNLLEPYSAGNQVLWLSSGDFAEEPSCSWARVDVPRLVSGKEYVVDFVWLASNLREQHNEILTITVEDPANTYTIAGSPSNPKATFEATAATAISVGTQPVEGVGPGIVDPVRLQARPGDTLHIVGTHADVWLFRGRQLLDPDPLPPDFVIPDVQGWVFGGTGTVAPDRTPALQPIRATP